MKHESNYYSIPVYPMVLLYQVEKRIKNRNRGEANTVLERGCGAGLWRWHRVPGSARAVLTALAALAAPALAVALAPPRQPSQPGLATRKICEPLPFHPISAMRRRGLAASQPSRLIA